jgi:surface polysaccharide O-acyltransferase-like enzyme
MFFILSGLLLGRAWCAKGCPHYDIKFLMQRFLKLWLPFLSFMIPYIIWLSFSRGISVMDALMNVFMLSWFAKLPAAGHLWFVTAILMLYLVMMILSRSKKTYRVFLGSVLTAVALICDITMHMVGIKQAYLMPLLTAGSIFFLFSDKIKLPDRFRNLMFMLFVCLAGCCVLIILPKDRILVSDYWLGIVSAGGAMGMIIVASSYIAQGYLTTTIRFLSGISFPVYLVHCVFLSDIVLPFRTMIPNDILFSFLYFIFAVIFGWLINSLACLVMICVKK